MRAVSLCIPALHLSVLSARVSARISCATEFPGPGALPAFAMTRDAYLERLLAAEQRTLKSPSRLVTPVAMRRLFLDLVAAKVRLGDRR